MNTEAIPPLYMEMTSHPARNSSSLAEKACFLIRDCFPNISHQNILWFCTIGRLPPLSRWSSVSLYPVCLLNPYALIRASQLIGITCPLKQWPNGSGQRDD